MKRTIATLGMTAASVVMLAAPALAHGVGVFQGNDYGTLSADHTHATMDDNECDSHQARFYYKTGLMVQAGQAFKYFGDPNGCAAGVGTFDTGGTGGLAIAKFKICEYNDDTGNLGCTDVHDA